MDVDVDANALIAVLGRRIGELEVANLALQIRNDALEVDLTSLRGEALRAAATP